MGDWGIRIKESRRMTQLQFCEMNENEELMLPMRTEELMLPVRTGGMLHT